MNNEGQEEYGIPIDGIPVGEVEAIDSLKQLNEQCIELVRMTV